jgi:uncharacterized RmlC-like cupin family protein
MNAQIIDGNAIPFGVSAAVESGSWKRILNFDQTEEGLVVGFGHLEQGEARGFHIHPKGEEEAIYITKGNPTAMWKENGEEKRQKMKPGEILYTPAGLDNNIANLEPEPAEMIFFIKTTPKK